MSAIAAVPLAGQAAQKLAAVLVEMGRTRELAVAVSGGVDSLTLMAFAHDVVPGGVRAFHAVSAAVPPAATARVQALAEERGWNLTLIDAGETTDPEYLNNPVDRCRVCKTHLYDAVASATAPQTQVLSGTNHDDLGDYRPGLQAAAAHGVRHPFVDAGLDKEAVRALAHHLELHDVAELPAQPCLSSRVETGIQISGPLLSMVNAVEDVVREGLGASVVVRCRVRQGGVVIELDERVLARLDDQTRMQLMARALGRVRTAGLDDTVSFAPYRMGSAFLRIL